MNSLDTKKRAQIIGLLVEGLSINATCRVTGASKNTVLKLLASVGDACWLYQDRVMQNLQCKRIECDEIWSFVGMKQKNVPQELSGVFGVGDVYTWVAIDADTKLVPSYFVGTRGYACAQAFIQDLAPRLANRVQLTTDGHKAYLDAIDDAFGIEIDYAQLVKMYGPSSNEDQRRYSPASFVKAEKTVVTGLPEMDKVSTSYVERQNLTMRMHMRRFTRLTNGFSKKIANHIHAVSLHFMYYNFCKIHKSLRVTPAMEAGIADHVWDIEEIIEMTDTNC